MHPATCQQPQLPSLIDIYQSFSGTAFCISSPVELIRAHGLIAFASLKKGLGKLILNEDALQADLHRNWAVVAEAIQTILHREGYPNPYETLKALTRTGSVIDENTIKTFIDGLQVSDSVKEELYQITPWSYTGF